MLEPPSLRDRTELREFHDRESEYKYLAKLLRPSHREKINSVTTPSKIPTAPTRSNHSQKRRRPESPFINSSGNGIDFDVTPPIS